MSTSMHNGGKWTDARYRSFIKSILRSGSNKWPPKYTTRKQAWRQRGIYVCAGFGRSSHEIPASILVGGSKRRVGNVFVDHIIPVGGPTEGGWDGVIDRLFCEADGLQILCKQCHDLKTKSERKKKV